MAAIVVRNIPDATHRALKARAKSHGRSAEAEVREILEAALSAEAGEDSPMMKAFRAFREETGGLDLDIPPRGDMPRRFDFE